MHKLKIYTNSNSDNNIGKIAHAVGCDAPEFLKGMLTCRCPEGATIPTQCAVLVGLAEYMSIPIEFEYVPDTEDSCSSTDTILNLVDKLVNTSNNPDASMYGSIIKLLINESHEYK